MAKTNVSIWTKVTLAVLIIGCSGCAKTCCKEHEHVRTLKTKRYRYPSFQDSWQGKMRRQIAEAAKRQNK